MTNRTDFDHTAYQTARAAKCAARAVAALEAGFASEAKRKEAQADVSRAYEARRDVERDALLPGLWNAEGTERDAQVEALLDAMPFDLHQWRAKHAAALASRPAFVAEVEALVELRAAIKAATVEPRPVREDHPLLTMARTLNISELTARRAEQYQDALDLGRALRDRTGAPLEGLPVYVNRVFCGNYAGTRWVRLDWFLSGKRVPFNTVAAAYDQLVREGTIVEREA